MEVRLEEVECSERVAIAGECVKEGNVGEEERWEEREERRGEREEREERGSVER